MIVLKNVTKVFSGKKALRSVSFATKEGEIIGFLGPNGAGKTTTMRMIIGYLKPTSGKVAVFGKDPISERLQVLPRIGYLPENNPLYTEMKAREYLQFIAGVKNYHDEEYLQEMYRKTGIDDVLETKIEELSRGYKQRVGLAASFIGDPRILILDEPTSGLDPIEQEKIRNLITSQKAKKTVILSTHILSEVEEVADRLIIIHKGSIVYDGAKPEQKGETEVLFRKLVS